MTSNIKTVKYPDLRNMVIQELKRLADKNIINCIDINYPHSFWDNLRFPIESLLDTLDLDVDSEENIGVTLYDEEEGRIVNKLAVYLNQLIQEVGVEKTDSAYLEWQHWEDLVKAAEAAFELLNANNYKYDFIYKGL